MFFNGQSLFLKYLSVCFIDTELIFYGNCRMSPETFLTPAETFLTSPETFLTSPETFLTSPETFLTSAETFLTSAETFLTPAEYCRSRSETSKLILKSLYKFYYCCCR